MSKTTSSNRLRIFLVKDDYDDYDIIIDFHSFSPINNSLIGENEDNFNYTCQQFDNHTVYLKQYINKPKKILGNFYDDLLKINNSTNINFSIADVYTLSHNNKNIKFVITFGQSQLINKESIEKRFGLKTLLGWYKEFDFSFKELSAKNVSKQGKTTIQHLSQYKENIKEFDFSMNTDIIKGIICSVKIPINVQSDNNENINNITEKKRTIQGDDSLKLNINYNHKSIINFLLTAYKSYNDEIYKNNGFGWIDNINEIKDKDVISKLEKELVTQINNDSKQIWISLPYEIFHTNIEKISYLNKNDKNYINDISLSEYKKKKNHSIDLENLKKDNIYLFDVDDQSIDYFSIFELLYAELEYQDNVYLLENKIWYIINNDFKKNVNEFYDKVENWDIHLPSNTFKREDEYNKNIADKNNDFLLMDKKNITISNDDKFELCDILSINKELIHVKKYGSSSILSHLFLQGLRSIEEIKSTNNIEKINKKIDDARFKLKKDDNFKIIFSIITSSKTIKPKIPFFAKSCFKHVGDKLDLYKVKFYINPILDESNK